jgi:hypothetical protein
MKLPKNILDIILSNKTSLGDNPALPPDLEDKFLVFLVDKYYEELLTHFDSIDIQELTDDLSSTMTECKNIENDNKEALEKLCSDIVNEIFNIPNDTLMIDMKLVDKVDTKQERLVPESSEGFSFDSIEDINSLTDEIYKRRLLNVLIMGASMYYSEHTEAYAHNLYKIDGKLKKLYDKIMCANDLLLFHTKQSLSNKQKDGGNVDVYISDELTPVKIESKGILFPILLEETIKGMLELSIAHGLPSERYKAEFITSKADFKLAELWDQRLGIPLWKRIIKTMDGVNEDPLEIGLNFFFMEISQLSPKQFNTAMQEIFANTKTGKHIVKEISNKIHHQKEMDDFNDYMSSHQSNQDEYPINDNDEFTADELINDDLCATTVLDEENY